MNEAFIINFLAQALSVGGLLHVLLALLVIGLILWVIWWAIAQIGLPAPMQQIVRVIFILIFVLVVLVYLLPLVGVRL